ncbi:hypothetical protein BDR03DRAFT_866470 [Suillus americanus]|nr:hypothetical protein BDR03DRAFT_866470 [Suillus americanus]
MTYEPDHNKWVKIALYIKQLIGGRQTVILAHLPTLMLLWKKFISKTAEIVFQHTVLLGHPQSKGTQPMFDCLKKILVYLLSNNTQWLGLAGKTLLLALIQPCQTRGRDGTKEEICYFRNLASIITDL